MTTNRRVADNSMGLGRSGTNTTRIAILKTRTGTLPGFLEHSPKLAPYSPINPFPAIIKLVSTR